MQDNQANSQPLIRLTNEVYQKLLVEGYKYALITDVQLNDETNISRQILQFVRELPLDNEYSSTGIIDEMITSVLNDSHSDIHIYINNSLA